MMLILSDDDMLPECGVLGPGSPAVVSLQLHPQGHVGAVGQSVDELVPVPELPRQVSESMFVILIQTLIDKVGSISILVYCTSQALVKFICVSSVKSNIPLCWITLINSLGIT